MIRKIFRSSKERRINRDHLKTIISYIQFLAKQVIAFRGSDEKKGSLNRGDFLELLKLKSDDLPALKERLELKNAIHYTCQKSQNEIIDILGGQINYN